ncbi:hypothetical protein TrLO_g11892 [Triparma laevis f. longispina]|uniref:THH1/TOM1/TOM3 domain-containing protein n=1 Tax=Triparma laevis f. longispina TaxID=1714387 RepID=A0A9W7AYF5_9STRA|nr:hypothetical protein TrLO_g11892 [Triparma laevis f. longispina]
MSAAQAMGTITRATTLKASDGGSSSSKSGGLTITINSFSLIIFISAFLYLLMQIFVQRKLRFLQARSPELDTKKLFVMSVWLACVVRVMSFVGLGALQIANVQVNYSMDNGEGSGDDDDVVDQNQAFYDKAVIVLFDLPDYIIVSTYVLMILVWAECFLESRFHTFKSSYFRKHWLIMYMVFNAILYGGQIVLYIILFMSEDAAFFGVNLRNLLFVIVTGINFVTVFFTGVLYLYLSFKFSGFPYRSSSAKKNFAKISQVIAYWSVARVIWGVAMLLSYENNIGWVSESDNSLISLVLIVLFIACELGPIFISLDYSLLSIIGLSDGANFGSGRGFVGGGIGGTGMLGGDAIEGYEALGDAEEEGLGGGRASPVGGGEDLSVNSSVGGQSFGSGSRGGSRGGRGGGGGGEDVEQESSFF